MELIAERPDAAPPYIASTRRFLLRRFLSSSSIACTTGMSKSSPWRTRGGGQVTGFSADMFMARDSNTFEHDRSFVRARRRALARLRRGIDLRSSPTGSRDDLHRQFGDRSVDAGATQGPVDATPADGSMGDEHE